MNASNNQRDEAKKKVRRKYVTIVVVSVTLIMSAIMVPISFIAQVTLAEKALVWLIAIIIPALVTWGIALLVSIHLLEPTLDYSDKTLSEHVIPDDILLKMDYNVNADDLTKWYLSRFSMAMHSIRVQKWTKRYRYFLVNVIAISILFVLAIVFFEVDILLISLLYAFYILFTFIIYSFFLSAILRPIVSRLIKYIYGNRRAGLTGAHTLYVHQAGITDVTHKSTITTLWTTVDDYSADNFYLFIRSKNNVHIVPESSIADKSDYIRLKDIVVKYLTKSDA